MTDRGQTANDYLVGIIVLLLTIAVVFGYFPSIFQPFDEPVGSEEEAMADNLGSVLITNTSAGGGEQTVNLTQIDVILDRYNASLQNDSAVPDWRQWNVTVRDGDGNIVSVVATGGTIRGGDTWDGSPSATTVRFVRAQNVTNAPQCANGCRIIVRVW